MNVIIDEVACVSNVVFVLELLISIDFVRLQLLRIASHQGVQIIKELGRIVDDQLPVLEISLLVVFSIQHDLALPLKLVVGDVPDYVGIVVQKGHFPLNSIGFLENVASIGIVIPVDCMHHFQVINTHEGNFTGQTELHLLSFSHALLVVE